MKRVLIVKTSSMGDVVHTLPALTDARRHYPGLVFDWVVEEAFTEIPAWHPAVDRVIPVAIRRWRKTPLDSLFGPEWRRAREQLAAEPYDRIVDAQGLLKSAVLTWFPQGVVCGYDWHSAREPLASLFYRQRHAVAKGQHAVQRTRALMAAALGYPVPDDVPDYGISRSRFGQASETPTVLFLHGTTRADKHWPDEYWQTLCRLVCEAGYSVKVPWWSDAEHRRAKQIAAVHSRAELLPRTSLVGMAGVIAAATAVVAVDTGLGHLTAALDVPSLSLYGPTSPALVGTCGRNQKHLCAGEYTRGPALSRVEPAVFAPLTPAIVFAALQGLLPPAR